MGYFPKQTLFKSNVIWASQSLWHVWAGLLTLRKSLECAVLHQIHENPRRRAFSGKESWASADVVVWLTASTAPLIFSCISCVIDTGKLYLTLATLQLNLWMQIRILQWDAAVRDLEGERKQSPHSLPVLAFFLRQGFITKFRLVSNLQSHCLRVPRAGRCRLAPPCWAFPLYAQDFLAVRGQQQWQSLLCTF